MESDEELVIIALLLDEEDEEERRGNKRKHRMWIHDIFKKRSQFGEYHTLFTDLLNDDVKFFQYFRMSHAKFKTLLDILSPHILRQNTTYREAIEPEQKLAVCLRYVLKTISFKY
ncbi:protein ALP1-like [Aphis craccivora]|uniref:Protein ALP1-like n=1 Tax=Aphis craccivora TaxID=307492 RepID=A0A6G0VYX2_APHCR|nr:protein ALP1-like [Aphis craccivora]